MNLVQTDSRQLERLVFRIPVMDLSDYPPLDLDNIFYEIDGFTLERLRVESRLLSSRNFSAGITFVYCRENEKGWFLDIYYINNNADRCIGCERYVIAKGFVMDEVAEKKFLEMINRSNTYYCDKTSDGLFSKLSSLEPEINLKNYPDMGMMLAHIYFAINRTGIRELMFKAGGLEYIAYNLSHIDEYNVIGSNISCAFDGVPITLLRKLNTVDGARHILKYPEHRTILKKIYKRYHSFLNDIDTLSYFQFSYLQQCFEKDEWPDKRMLCALGNLGMNEKSVFDPDYVMNYRIEATGLKPDNEFEWALGNYSFEDVQTAVNEYEAYEYANEDIDEDEEEIPFDTTPDYKRIFSNYLEYHYLLGRAGKFSPLFPKYPSLKGYKIYDFLSLYGTLSLCVFQGEKYDEGIGMTSKKIRSYIYSDDKYMIFPPEGLLDMLLESRRMHNCLRTYVDAVANGTTYILYMRDVNSPEESLVCMEVRRNRIVQALRKCNEPVTEEQLQFIKKFAEAKGLRIKKSIEDAVYDEEDYDEFDDEELPFH